MGVPSDIRAISASLLRALKQNRLAAGTLQLFSALCRAAGSEPGRDHPAPWHHCRQRTSNISTFFRACRWTSRRRLLFTPSLRPNAIFPDYSMHTSCTRCLLSDDAVPGPLLPRPLGWVGFQRRIVDARLPKSENTRGISYRVVHLVRWGRREATPTCGLFGEPVIQLLLVLY